MARIDRGALLELIQLGSTILFAFRKKKIQKILQVFHDVVEAYDPIRMIGKRAQAAFERGDGMSLSAAEVAVVATFGEYLDKAADRLDDVVDGKD